MAAPTFVASYSSAYNTGTSPKTVSVTTQAGDIVVVTAVVENGQNGINAPTGNSINFTEQQLVDLDNTWAMAGIWTGTDANGGTNWTLSISNSSGSLHFGMTCYVFRSSNGIGASSKTNADFPGEGSSLNLTTTDNNSAIVVVSCDWEALDGSSRTWRTVNGITPTSGNGLERNYQLDSGAYSSYDAYYNDAGAAGSKTVGLSAPTGQRYSICAVEIKGTVSKAATLVDNFNDNSLNTSLWSTFGSNYAETGGQFTIFPASNSPEYVGITSNSLYDLRSSSVVVKCIQTLSNSSGCEAILSARQDGSNYYAIMVSGNSLVCRLKIAGANNDTSVTYDSSTMVWWRIREFAGIVYWDTSPNGCYWTNRRTTTTIFVLTNMNLQLEAGTWQNVASPGTAIFDNFNITSITGSGGWLKG